MRDVEKGVPMTTDTIFRIASQTKAITSVGVMMLVEDGRLLLTDPVAKHLPAFATTTVRATGSGETLNAVAARRPITIRDLLTHTAGVSYGGEPELQERYAAAGLTQWYFADKTRPIATLVDTIATLPFEAQPGERFVYGYSTDILGAVIEKVSGMPLDRYFASRILDPLKMTDTHFFLPASKASRLAAVYSRTANTPVQRAPDDQGAIGRRTRPGAIRRWAARGVFRRRRAALDGQRLRAVPADDAEQGGARWRASPEPEDR